MSKVSKAVLDEITRLLVAEFQPEKVILFGSHAWGSPDSCSDIDLLVIVSESTESPVRRAYRAYQCLSDIDLSKDILVKTHAEAEKFRHVRASLMHKIFDRGTVLYGYQVLRAPPALEQILPKRK